MPESRSSERWASGRSLLARITYLISPWRPWAPPTAIAVAYLARLTGSMILRGLSSVVAFILFLLVSVDAARSLWEVDRGPVNPLRHSEKAPVTPFHLVLAAALALIYTFSIIGILASFFLVPPLWVFLIIGPFAFAAAGLVAWHNVRLWAFQGVEYEELLDEAQRERAEKERLKQMRTNLL
ncbi:MAG TPA: hypothetical protein VKH81_17970 [Candidatus Angelobacter sp.]|nr:hypothetical protein [Candidatus Angelobacter sp.]